MVVNMKSLAEFNASSSNAYQNTCGHVYKSLQKTSGVSGSGDTFISGVMIQNTTNTGFSITLKKLSIIFNMVKSNVNNYNIPFVWSLQYQYACAQGYSANAPLSNAGYAPHETPLEHNYQPDMSDTFNSSGSTTSTANTISKMVACGVCSGLSNCEYEFPEPTTIYLQSRANNYTETYKDNAGRLYLVIEPEDKTTNVQYYAEAVLVYQNDLNPNDDLMTY